MSGTGFRWAGLCAAAAFLAMAIPAEPAPAWADLFNGRDLAGWVNVNTDSDTWTVRDGLLICKGRPIGVMRSEKRYENFLLRIEWRHMEQGGNSGVFVWSNAVPGKRNRLPDGVEVQMLDPGWVELNARDGWRPPVAYAHGELFGVGGVVTIPENPRGPRSRSIENRVRGRGEWNTYEVAAIDGAIKLAVNGKFVNGVRDSTQREGYLCLESEGAEIHFRSIKLLELPPSASRSEIPVWP